MIDQLTSQVHLVPTMITVTARGVMWLILKEVVRLHGTPESIVSDRDTCYEVIYQRLRMELLSPMAVMSEGLGFNLCVAPFLNICVPNLQ